MPNDSSSMFRVRRIGRRHLAGEEWLSRDEGWRGSQLKLVAYFGAGALLLVGLALRKAWSLLGPNAGWVFVLVGGALTAMLVRSVRSALRRRKAGEPEDIEEALNASAIQMALRSRRISPTDLVFENGAWTTLLESSGFDEEAFAQHRALQRIRSIQTALAIVGGGLVALGGFVFLMNFGEIFFWLMRD